jgi:hypothetical protein
MLRSIVVWFQQRLFSVGYLFILLSVYGSESGKEKKANWLGSIRLGLVRSFVVQYVPGRTTVGRQCSLDSLNRAAVEAHGSTPTINNNKEFHNNNYKPTIMRREKNGTVTSTTADI